jgi:hypothetical protein
MTAASLPHLTAPAGWISGRTADRLRRRRSCLSTLPGGIMVE